MHILFLGKNPLETRTHVLISEAIRNNHKVTVLSSALLGIFTPFMRIDTIHVHNFATAVAIRIALIFSRKTTTVWTVSSIPEFSNPYIQAVFQRFFVFIASKFTTITTPSRTVQYRLLSLYSVKSEYIPDGYSPPILPDIRPAVYGLRKEQYGIIFSNNIDQLKKIAKTYKQFRSTKKLVIFSERTYMGINSINLPVTSRGAQSLVRQAAFVIITGPNYSQLALQAMDAGRNIIATTEPLHEELFGTTAKYYEKSDTAQLEKLLRDALNNRSFNTASQIRAKNHFQWEKTAQEYMRIYRHSATVLVPIDSIIPRNSFQTAE